MLQFLLPDETGVLFDQYLSALWANLANRGKSRTKSRRGHFSRDQSCDVFTLLNTERLAPSNRAANDLRRRDLSEIIPEW